MDLILPVWGVFDLLPSGRGELLPDNCYLGRVRGWTAMHTPDLRSCRPAGSGRRAGLEKAVGSAGC